MTDCVLCGNPLKRVVSLGWVFSLHNVKEPLICLKCEEGFEEIKEEKACPGCFQQQETRERCAACTRWQENYPEMPLQHRALYVKNDSGQALLDRIKKQGDLVVTEVFQEILFKRLKGYQRTHIILPLQNPDDSMALFLKAAGITYEQIDFTQVKKPEKFKRPLLLVGDVYTTGENFMQMRERLGGDIVVETFSLFR